MLSDTANGKREGLLHHTPGLELVTVGQAADKAPFALPVDAQPGCFTTRPAEGLPLGLDAFDIVI